MTESEFIYENIAFEGGGVRGYAYTGVIKQLEVMGHLSKFKRFSGTSVGALFATMLAVGFTADEILGLRKRLDFSDISSKFSLRSLYGICVDFGMNTPNDLENQFRNILKDRVNPDITLSDLYRLNGKDLVIVTCCISREKPVYLHHARFPEVKLIDAMIASVSVPFVFQPRMFDWFGTNDYYVDGGLVDNYPIWVFNDIEKLYTGDLHLIDKDKISPLTLGIKLLCTGEKNNAEVYDNRRNLKTVIQFGEELVNTLMMQIERNGISPTYISQTISVKTGNINFLDFKINSEEIDKLVKNGHKGVELFFKHNTWDIVE